MAEHNAVISQIQAICAALGGVVAMLEVKEVVEAAEIDGLFDGLSDAFGEAFGPEFSATLSLIRDASRMIGRNSQG